MPMRLDQVPALYVCISKVGSSWVRTFFKLERNSSGFLGTRREEIVNFFKTTIPDIKNLHSEENCILPIIVLPPRNSGPYPSSGYVVLKT